MLNPGQIEVPDDEVVAILRRMTPEERLTVANRMWVSARQAVESIVRAEHPELSAELVRQEIVRRMLHGAV
jgi:hypothetical protein